MRNPNKRTNENKDKANVKKRESFSQLLSFRFLLSSLFLPYLFSHYFHRNYFPFECSYALPSPPSSSPYSNNWNDPSKLQSPSNSGKNLKSFSDESIFSKNKYKKDKRDYNDEQYDQQYSQGYANGSKSKMFTTSPSSSSSSSSSSFFGRPRPFHHSINPSSYNTNPDGRRERDFDRDNSYLQNKKEKEDSTTFFGNTPYGNDYNQRFNDQAYENPSSEREDVKEKRNKSFGKEKDKESLQESDMVEKYCSTISGKTLIVFSSSIVGLSLGGILSAWFVGNRNLCCSIGIFIGFLLALFNNNAFSKLFRGLGLGLILFMKHLPGVLKPYPVLRQIVSATGLSPRRPFPPCENPWRYVPNLRNDIEFSMYQSVAAIGFLGSLLGWTIGKIVNIFILPSWLLTICFGSCFAYISTLRDARGDLARCTGMKIAALVGLLRDIDNQLLITSRFMKALHISFLTANQVDRQYGIRDKLMNILGRIYTILSGAAAQVQNDMAEGEDGKAFPSFSPHPSERPRGSRNQAPYKDSRWMDDDNNFRRY